MGMPALHNFRALFDVLLDFALSRGVPLHDAEDLVGATLEAACRSFNEERGSFRALCITILSNRIKNYWRDRKPGLPLPEEVEDPEWAAGFTYGRSDTVTRQMLETIMAGLSREEKNFLVQLRAVYEEMDDRAISETARRLGLEPAKGWDIFRRIQRKARKTRPAVLFSKSAASPADNERVQPADAASHYEPAVYTPDRMAESRADFSTESSRSEKMRPRVIPKPESGFDLRLLADFAGREAIFEKLLAGVPPDLIPAIESDLAR